MVDNKLNEILFKERDTQILEFIRFVSSVYIMPLFLFFSIADYIWYRSFFFEFLLVRVLTAVGALFLGQYSDKIIGKHLTPNHLGVILILICGLPINYMLFRIGKVDTPYYAGLMLIATGVCSGLRLNWPHHIVAICSLALPLIINAIVLNSINTQSFFLLNFIFFSSISIIGSTGKYYYEKLNIKEIKLRLQLGEELENRAKIIDIKTQENIKLNDLSRQFSPQIIDSIKKGDINVNSAIHNSEIAVIVVDIVDSTKKIISLNNDNVQQIVSLFMFDVMNEFLKFDVTIDKFMGDGFMGFTNDPFPRNDYLERAILASESIIKRINSNKGKYDHLWKDEFKIRISVASGVAATGFYGNEKLLKTYTAIGRPVILSNRLNGVGQPFTLNVSVDVLEKIKISNPDFLKSFKVTSSGFHQLKGFDGEEIESYAIERQVEAIVEFDDESCPNGHGPLSLELVNGIYDLKCRHCDFTAGQNVIDSLSHKKAS